MVTAGLTFRMIIKKKRSNSSTYEWTILTSLGLKFFPIGEFSSSRKIQTGDSVEGPHVIITYHDILLFLSEEKEHDFTFFCTVNRYVRLVVPHLMILNGLKSKFKSFLLLCNGLVNYDLKSS